MEHLIFISEQHRKKEIPVLSEYLKAILVRDTYSKSYHHNNEMLCFQMIKEKQSFLADTNYFVGVDWLEEDKAAVYVEPKLNEQNEVNFLGMLLQSMEATENLNHLSDLLYVGYDKPWITIPQQKDILSPILIVQFLKLLQSIVRKGLKKSYYSVTSNLNSRVKGKILIGQQIQQNISKNKITHAVCRYQEFGLNTRENQFLKLVLQFANAYLHKANLFFDAEQNSALKQILRYCQPAFQHVEVLEEKHYKVHVKKNVFYREYEEAVKIGEYILKRFSFNISKASSNMAATPPFWVDMSKLFELYVFGKLQKALPTIGAVTYHDRFAGGKETDILIRQEPFKCVIDCKYKPQYANGAPSLDDKRQVLGYTRLKSVYDRLAISQDELIKAVIVYSDQNCSPDVDISKLLTQEISEYVEFYKFGIRLPELFANC